MQHLKINEANVSIAMAHGAGLIADTQANARGVCISFRKFSLHAHKSTF